MAKKKVHINFEIDHKAATHLLSYYEKRRTELIELLKKISKETEEISEIIKNIKKSLPIKDSTYSYADSTLEEQGMILREELYNFNPTRKTEYSKDLSLARKAEHVLSSLKRVMTSREISEEIVLREPDFFEDSTMHSINHLNSRLSATLKQKVDQGITFNRTRLENNNEYLYGLARWFNSDGSLPSIYLQ